MKTIAVVLPDGPSASFRINGPTADRWYTGLAVSRDGVALGMVLVDDQLADTQLEITRDGFAPFGRHVHLGTGDQQIRVGVPADPNRPMDIVLDGLEPLVAPLSFTARGRYLYDAGGKRTVLRGTDQFMALRQVADGIDITPYLRESNELGINLWRVFFMGSKPQNQVMDLNPTDPGIRQLMRPLANTLNQHGIVLLATVNVDSDHVVPEVPRKIENWHAVAGELAGTVSALSAGNEWRKNGFFPGDFTDPGVGLPWSRGSDLSEGDNEHAPYRPYGTFAEYHPIRTLRTRQDTVASPLYIFEERSLNAPLWCDEPPRMGFDASMPECADPDFCGQLARAWSVYYSAVVFHNRFGQSGRLMDDLTHRCAEAVMHNLTL